MLKTISTEIGNLGTNSCRKGVGTMVVAGCTPRPLIVSICVRGGWAMGRVIDKVYLVLLVLMVIFIKNNRKLGYDIAVTY